MDGQGNDQRNVDVRLTADVDPFKQGMEQSSKSVGALTEKVVALGKAVDDTIKKAGKGLILFGTGQLAGIGAGVVAMANLERQMRTTRASFAVTNGDINAMTNSIRSMAGQLPASTAELTQLLNVATSLGITGVTQLEKFVKTATQLGAATGEDATSLAAGLGELMKTTGAVTDNVDRYSSELVKLKSVSGASAQSILGFAQAIQSTAQTAGLSTSQILSMSAGFEKVGADGYAAANLFNNTMTQISLAVTTSSPKLKQFANIMGMTTDQLKTMYKDHPEQVFIALMEGIQHQGQYATSTLAQLGLEGGRNVRVINALTSGQANLAQVMEQGNTAYVKNTDLSKASTAAWNDLASQLTRFREIFGELATAMGGPWIQGLTKALEGVNKFADWMMSLPGMKSFVIPALGAIGTAVGLIGGAATLAFLALVKFAAVWRIIGSLPVMASVKGLKAGFTDKDVKNLNDYSKGSRMLYDMTAGWGQRMAAFRDRVNTRAAAEGDSGGGGFLRLFTPAARLRAGWNEVKDTVRPRNLFNPEYRDSNMTDPLSTTRLMQDSQAAYLKVMASIKGRDDAIGRIMAKYDPMLGTRISKSIFQSKDRAQYQRRIQGLIWERFSEAWEDEKAAWNVAAMNDPSKDPSQNPYNSVRAKARAGRKYMNAARDEAGRQYDQMTSYRAQFGMPENVAKPIRVVVDRGEEMVSKGFERVFKSSPLLDNLRAKQAQRMGLTPDVDTTLGPLPSDPERQGGRRFGALRTAGRLGWWAARSPIGRIGGGLAGGAMMATAMASDASGNPSLIGTLGAAAGGAMTGASMGSLAGPWGAVAGGLIGAIAGAAPAIDKMAHAAENAALALGGLQGPSQETASYLGLNYEAAGVKGPTTNPGDKISAWSPQEVTDAMSDSFAKTFSKTLQQAKAAGPGGAQGYFQAQINDIVRGINGGSALTPQEQMAIRQQLIAASGGNVQQAQAIYSQLNPNGTTAMDAFNLPHPNLNSNDAKTRGAVASQLAGQTLTAAATGDFKSAAAEILQVQKESLSNPDVFKAYAKSIESQNPDLKVGGSKNIEDLMVKLYKADNPAARAFLKGLHDAGISNEDAHALGQEQRNAATGTLRPRGVNAAADQVSQAAISTLNTALDTILAKVSPGLGGTGSTNYGMPRDLNFALGTTNVGSIARGMGISDLRDIANDPQKMVQGMTAINTALEGQSNDVRAAALAWADYMSKLDPTDPRYQLAAQALDAENQKLATQIQLFSATPMDQAQQWLDMATKIAKGPDAGSSKTTMQDYVNNANQALTAGEQQLMGYLIQVRDMNRQIGYINADFRLSQFRAERDYQINVTEMTYQENERKRKAMLNFNEQVRAMTQETAKSAMDPYQRIQSQFTFDADSLLVNFRQQSQYLKQMQGDLGRLRKMGVSNDVIKLLGLDDPKNFQQLNRFVISLVNDPKLVSQWNAAAKDKLDISQAITLDPSNSKLNELKRQLGISEAEAKRAWDHTMKMTADAFARSQADAEQNLGITLSRMHDQFNTIGQSIAKDFPSLIKAAMDSGIKPIKDFATQLQTQYEQIKKTIKTLGDLQIGIQMYFVVPSGSSSANAAEYSMQNMASANGAHGPNYYDKNSASSTKSDAYKKMIAMGWGPSQWGSLNNLVTGESGWNPTAKNPTSTAYGLFQFLDSTWATVGGHKTSDPALQTDYGLRYIKERYGSPSNAWSFWLSHSPHWYAQGGVFGSGGQVIGVGEQGPEAVLPLNDRGADFIATLLDRRGALDARKGRTSQYATQVHYSGSQNYHYDNSTNFNGAITVMAADTKAFQREMEQQKRLRALRRPSTARS